MGMSQLINDVSGLLANFTAKKNELNAAVSAALGALSLERVYHVDTVLGSDTNAGTSVAPFKTLKKAIDTVPIGGVGTLKLVPGQVHVIPYGQNINMFKKHVTVLGKVGEPKPAITNETVYLQAENTLASSGFTLRDSVLVFQSTKFVTTDRPAAGDAAGLVGYRGYGIISRYDQSSGWVSLYNCEVELNQTSFMRLPTGGCDLDFAAFDTKITNPGPGKLLDLDSGVPIKASFASMVLPVGVKLGDLIGNIYRDVNGNPTNILCNVALPETVV